MKFLLVIFFLIFSESSYGQLKKNYQVDTVSIFGSLIESRYFKYTKNEKKQKSLFIDNPTYYVLLDSSISRKNIASRFFLNQYRVQNDSLKLLCNDKELVDLDSEFFENSLKNGCNIQLHAMFNDSQKKSKLKFRDEKNYQYKVKKCILRCLRFKIPRTILVEKDILTKYAFYNDFVYFFIVFEINGYESSPINRSD